MPKSPGPVIGVVHLLPLPGSPRYGGSMAEVLRRAVADARAYAKGGADAVIVENYGDAPFFKEGLPAEAVAALAVAAAAVGDAVKLPFGVNALRNDARAALGVAAAAGAAFLRVNVHAGVTATDQGLVEGRAAETLRVRRLLGADVSILADVHVKHGRQLDAGPIGDAARDLVLRGGADGVIVSGASTGRETDLADLRAVRAALPRAFVLAGSGVRAETVASVLAVADAVIVGTSLKRGGRTEAPVDAARVARFTRAARGGARGRGR
ncbi:MAG TPA: BtpA/SgcQ family protein [Planctomycetota bacterium]|nr:BtpA/SgcQ family protein [Planctomycetota bacterium]